MYTIVNDTRIVIIVVLTAYSDECLLLLDGKTSKTGTNLLCLLRMLKKQRDARTRRLAEWRNVKN